MDLGLNNKFEKQITVSSRLIYYRIYNIKIMRWDQTGLRRNLKRSSHSYLLTAGPMLPLNCLSWLTLNFKPCGSQKVQQQPSSPYGKKRKIQNKPPHCCFNHSPHPSSISSLPVPARRHNELGLNHFDSCLICQKKNPHHEKLLRKSLPQYLLFMIKCFFLMSDFNLL